MLETPTTADFEHGTVHLHQLVVFEGDEYVAVAVNAAPEAGGDGQPALRLVRLPLSGDSDGQTEIRLSYDEAAALLDRGLVTPRYEHGRPVWGY